MKKIGSIALVIMLIVLRENTVTAQRTTWKDTSSYVVPELKHALNKSGSHYLKATFVSQMWLRQSELNPGTLINNTVANSYSDIGIRRIRFSAFGQLTDRIYFYTQFGQNNFNFLSKRYTGAFIHDAITEYKIAPQIQLGVGLTGWSGLSRYASPAVGSLLAIDAPLYQQATNGYTDQFLRKLSCYAKGQISKLDYRIAVTSPMTAQNSSNTLPAIGSDANFSMDLPKLQTQGYLFWQFFDKENNTNPYTVGTYLGKKKVFNIGAGWIQQNKAMWYKNNVGDTIRQNMLLLGVDAFLDLPIAKKGAAITAYFAYNNYSFGKNYLRNGSVMNPGTGVTANGTLNGAGVGAPIIGTGNTIFAQVGYKFKNDLLKEKGTLQPYCSTQLSFFDKLHQPMLLIDGGINWLIHGNHAGKISLGYQSRPIFEMNANNEYVQTHRKGMMVLQYQISL
jgi:hypothetical protein